jgi:hypothetical protein
VKPENLILLLPRCLQRAGCAADVAGDIANCKRCGRCKVGDMARIAEAKGIRCAVATGGEQALALVKSDDVHAIIAVACEKELAAGIWHTMPKPVLAVINLRPNGPCRDTDVDMASVEEALECLLAADDGEE